MNSEVLYRNRWEVALLRVLIMKKQRRVARLWRVVLGVDLGDKWPQGMILPHPWGVVVHSDAQLGKRCVLYQGVTIGANLHSAAAPSIGERVRVFANASIIGPVTIGDDAIVGANAVVVHDVPARTVVAGNPARVIRAVRDNEALTERNFSGH